MPLRPSTDAVINTVAALSAPVLTFLTDEHVLSALAATDIGAIVGAGVAAYHGGTWTQRRTAARRPQVVATVHTRDTAAAPSSSGAVATSSAALVTPGDTTAPSGPVAP